MMYDLIVFLPLIGFLFAGLFRRVIEPRTAELVTSGLLAVVSYPLTDSYFLTIFFGYFAFLNYQILQTIHRAHVMGLHDDDWWRK